MGTYYLVHESLGKRHHRPGMSPDAEKARHGGLAVRDKYGPEYYRELGRKGGQQTKARYGAEHYTRIGKRGGAARIHNRVQSKQ